MSSLRHYISLVEAAFLTEKAVRVSIYGEPITVQVNPAPAVVVRMLETVSYGELRWIVGDRLDLYVWPASGATHDDVTEALGEIPGLKGHVYRAGIRVTGGWEFEWSTPDGSRIIADLVRGMSGYSSLSPDEVPAIMHAFPGYAATDD